jgi:hypothetical protein
LTDARQNLVKALEHSASDLDTWVRKQGWTVDELCQMFTGVLQENGIAARIILDKAQQYIPEAAGIDITPDEMIKALAAIRSKRVDGVVPNEETASSEVTSKLEANIRDALPNLRESLLKSGKTGPQHRRGGRPEELADPEVHEEIRAKIKKLRGPGIRLNDLLDRIGREYGVSASKIKRIFYESLEKP